MNINEANYWRDFFRGLPLDKYGDKIVKSWSIDKFQAAELFMGAW